MEAISKQFMEEYDRGLKQNALIPLNGRVNQLDSTTVKTVKVGSTSYSPSNGVVTLPENTGAQYTQKVFLDENGGSLTPSMINTANTIYVIQYDYIMSDNINIPNGCMLEFAGGSISGSGKTLMGNNTVIMAAIVQIFGTDITLGGTWAVDSFWVNWFGAKGDGVTDDTDAIQKAFNLCHRYIYPARTGYNRYDISFLKGTYILKKSLLVSPRTYIHGNGSVVKPVKGQFTVVRGKQRVFIVNLNSDMTKPDMTYPDLWGMDDFIFGDYYDYNEGEDTVGLIYSAAAGELRGIKIYNLCPFYATTISPYLDGRSPADDEVDYQDRLSMDDIKMFCNDYFRAANAGNCMIEKKTQGDTNRFSLIQNETHLMCFYIWSTYGGTIIDCLHPDGYIYDSFNFSIQDCHYEKNQIQVLYSNVKFTNCFFHVNDGFSPIFFQEMYPQKRGQAHGIELDSCSFVQLWSSLYNPKPVVHIGSQADYHNVSVRNCRKYIGYAFGINTANAIDIYDQKSNTIICLNMASSIGSYRNVMPTITLSESGESGWNPSTTIKDGAEAGTYAYEFYFGDFNKTKSFFAGYKVTASITTNGKKYLGFLFDNAPCGVVAVKRTSPSSVVRYAVIPMSFNGVFLDCYNHINGSPWTATRPVNYYLGYTGFADMAAGEIVEYSPINTVFTVNTARKWVKELNTDELKDLTINSVRQNKKGEINFGQEVFVSRIYPDSVYKLLNLSTLGSNYHECQYIICANTSAVLCRVENNNGAYAYNFRAFGNKCDELKLYKDGNNVVYIKNTTDFSYSVSIIAVSSHAEYCIAQNYAGALDTATLPETATEIVLEQPTSGESADRPNTLTASDKGFQFYDETEHKPIYWTNDTSNGKSGWVDAMGNNMPNP